MAADLALNQLSAVREVAPAGDSCLNVEIDDVVGGSFFGLPNTVDLLITKNTLANNDVGVWLFNADQNGFAPTSRPITNDAVTNTTGDSMSPACGYQAGISDVGTKDLIVNNSISGFGYTPTAGGDCTGSTPAFLRFIDADASARGVSSNK